GLPEYRLIRRNPACLELAVEARHPAGRGEAAVGPLEHELRVERGVAHAADLFDRVDLDRAVGMTRDVQPDVERGRAQLANRPALAGPGRAHERREPMHDAVR